MVSAQLELSFLEFSMHSSRLGLVTRKICMGFEDRLESTGRHIVISLWGQAPLQLIQPISLWWLCIGQHLSRRSSKFPWIPLQLLLILVMLGANTVAKHSSSFAGNPHHQSQRLGDAETPLPVPMRDRCRFCCLFAGSGLSLSSSLCVQQSFRLLVRLTLSRALDPGAPGLRRQLNQPSWLHNV